MQPHPEPENQPPPLPLQRPGGESVTRTKARIGGGSPLVLGGGHGRPSAWTTLRTGSFPDDRRDRKLASIPTRMVPHLVAYVGVMVLLVLIWLLVGVNGGGWYPWPMWPALGWGAGIACKLTGHGAVRCAAR